VPKPPVLRLLAVDDEPRDLRLLEIALAEQDVLDVPMQSARTLAEGLALLKRETFDVVVLDLGLPDASRLEGLRQMRNASPGVAIVVFTGLADRDLAAEAQRQGAQDYLVKGHLTGELIHRVLRYAVDRKRFME
jgi:two-component system, cell cycle sensor histidine kinase and response regulator CckA